MQLFELGQIVATPGGLELLGNDQAKAIHYIGRHVSGDFGEVGRYDEDIVTDDILTRGPLVTGDGDKLNTAAVMQDSIGDWQMRILSEYMVSNGRLWIITEADRGVTTLLLPDEY